MIGFTVPTRTRSLRVALLAALAVGTVPAGALPASAMLQSPTTPPPAQSQPTERSMEAIVHDFAAVSRSVTALLPDMQVPSDMAKRAALAPKVLPDLRRMGQLLGEMAIAEPRAKLQVRQNQQELTALMAMLGDPESVTTLKNLSVSNDREEAASAQAWLLVLNWEKAHKEPLAQDRIAADFTALTKAHRTNDVLTQVASLLIEEAATPVIGEKIEQAVMDNLTGPLARDLSAQVQRVRHLRALIGRPLVIAGTMPEGKPFTSTKWKGKVVLVDFWATWSPPSLENLSRLKKLYAADHARGLEIIGVSSDSDLDNFKAFLADNKDMAWPQIIDPGTPDVHPLVKTLGIEMLPTLFVIDKKGIVRSITGVEDAEKTIDKLIAE